MHIYLKYQAAPHLNEVDCKIHETLAFQEWIWIRRKLAKCIIFICIESTRRSLKNIYLKYIYLKNIYLKY